MKINKLSYLGIAGALALASCSSDIDAPSTNVNDGYLKVNGSISELTKTRATETNFVNGDKIGVSGGIASNVLYTYNGSSFASEVGIKVTAETGFTAYYPYSESANGSIAFDVTSQQDVDFLFAPEVKATVENPTATFSFFHKMSQIALTVKDQTTNKILNDVDVKVTLQNVVLKGSFNTTTGAVTPDASTGNLAISEVEVDIPSVVIVPSFAEANKNAITVVVAAGEKTYTGSITPVLAASNRYSYDLNIVDGATPEDPEADLVITGSITGWTNNDGDGPEMEENYVLSVGDFLLKDGSTKSPNDKEFDSFKNNIVGVVYYVKGEGDVDVSNFGYDIKNGLAIALNNAGQGRFNANNADINAWCTTNADKVTGMYTKEMNIGSSGPTNNLFAGYNNTQIFKLSKDAKTTNGSGVEQEPLFSNELLSLLETANNTKIGEASEWYLPNFGEFYTITSQIIIINKSLAKAQGTTLDKLSDYNQNTLSEGWYWTSTLRGSSNAWVSIIDNEYSDPTKLFESRNSAGKSGWFRFAIAF